MEKSDLEISPASPGDTDETAPTAPNRCVNTLEELANTIFGEHVVKDIKERLFTKQWLDDWDLSCEDAHTGFDKKTVELEQNVRLHKIAAATLYIFFAQLLPAITFGFFVQEATHNAMGVIETVLSMAIGGTLFALFAGQPMVVVGVTGPVCLFCVGLYRQAMFYGFSFYGAYFWTCFWTAVFHILIAYAGLCETFQRVITGFSADSFGALIGLIYIYEGINEMIKIWNLSPLTAFFFSLVLAIGTTELTRVLASLKNTGIFNFWFRELLCDYAAVIAIVALSALQLLPSLDHVGLPLIDVPTVFQPSDSIRSWLVSDHIRNSSPALIFGCIAPAIVLTALLYFDHNISAILSMNASHKDSKTTYNWDFLLLGFSVLVCGLLCIPPNYGLLPQAPLHVKHLTYDANKIREKKERDVDPKHVLPPDLKTIETRWSALGQSMLMWGLLSPNLLYVLGLIPKGVLAGLFVFLGLETLDGNGLVLKTINILTWEKNNRPIALTNVNWIAYFRMTMTELFCVAVIFVITFTDALIAFPLFIVGMVGIQMLIDRWAFSSEDSEKKKVLQWLGDAIILREAQDAEDDACKKVEAESVKERYKYLPDDWEIVDGLFRNSSVIRQLEEMQKNEESIVTIEYSSLEKKLHLPYIFRHAFKTVEQMPSMTPYKRRSQLDKIDPKVIEPKTTTQGRERSLTYSIPVAGGSGMSYEDEEEGAESNN